MKKTYIIPKAENIAFRSLMQTLSLAVNSDETEGSNGWGGAQSKDSFYDDDED